MIDLVKEKLKLLPESPGVYMMKDKKNNIIYVGKAIILKNRVRQYFQNNKNHQPKVKAMVGKIADFETIMTSSEVEALILECNLIKKHRPKYNVSLKDDKSYPYIKVTMQDDYPRITVTRRIFNDGAKYFGPYTNAGAVHESISLIKKLFPLRSCRRMNAKRPCLEYHIKRCLAPCAGMVEKAEYEDMIASVLLLLEGRTEKVQKSIFQKMQNAAENLMFESAARFRDQLNALKKISEKQNIIAGTKDQDIIGIAKNVSDVCVQLFFIREGKMVGREHFLLDISAVDDDETILGGFLKQYYFRATFIPGEILLPFEINESELLGKWLTEKASKKVVLEVPKRGNKLDIVKMAIVNAEKFLQDEASQLEQIKKKTIEAAKELGKYLGMVEYPHRIECFDISHIQGTETVASMVVFEDGSAKKCAYKRFKIKSAEGKPDDFLSMKEVTLRRYGKNEIKDMPNLIIIDGGKGQLSSALEIIRGAGHRDTVVIGLAKQYEYIFRENLKEPLILPRNSQAFYLIQRIRDEAHRFAITYHRKLRGKRNLTSILDNISGIGAKRRNALLSHFGNINNIKNATIEELANIKGLNKSIAQTVYNYFNVKKR